MYTRTGSPQDGPKRPQGAPRKPQDGPKFAYKIYKKNQRLPMYTRVGRFAGPCGARRRPHKNPFKN